MWVTSQIFHFLVEKEHFSLRLNFIHVIKRIIIGSGIVLVVLAVLYFVALPTVAPELPELPSLDLDENPQVQVHTIVVEEVQGMGYFQLAKLNVQDIITHSVEIDYLPDPKVILKVIGEAAACVDFGQIDSTDILFVGDSMFLKLPAPQICYTRVDHDQSEIIETSNMTLYMNLNDDGQELINQAFTLAEEKIRSVAVQNGIFEVAEAEADKMLVPLLRRISQKDVFLVFEDPLRPKELDQILEEIHPQVPATVKPFDSVPSGTRPSAIRP